MTHAGVVKLVDTQRSGRCESNLMEVQVLSPAQAVSDNYNHCCHSELVSESIFFYINQIYKS